MGVKCYLGGTAIQTLKLVGLSATSASLLCRQTTPSSSFLRTLSTFAETSSAKGVKPTWKAAIDFKWIREKKEAVAANIMNRNSAADLDLVLHLYDKFNFLKNEAVMLEMALINWTLSDVMKIGFTPLTTPEIVRSAVVEKCGFQPRGDNTQVYSIEGTDQCLIGTAEIPVGGIHVDSILSESMLPLKYAAFSHCFRTEAVHQFSKVEMFIFCQPKESDDHHEELIQIEEDLFCKLGLHCKTLDMSSGDLGAPAYRKFDVEAWMPCLERYGEISSASNCTIRVADLESGIGRRKALQQTQRRVKATRLLQGLCIR